MSGDWQASTDHIDQRLIIAVWRAISRSVKTDSWLGSVPLDATFWAELGEADLVRHTLFCPTRSRVGRVGDHTTGQLMGSPCSFPILCIINAAIVGHSLHISARDLVSGGFDRARCNGDDVAIVTDPAGVETWKRVSSDAGLLWSPGKTYISTWFVQMNSECYQLTDGVYTRVGSLNPSLAFGLERKGIEAGKDLRPDMAWGELGDRARELIEGVPEEVQQIWLDRFEFWHKGVLERIPPGTARETPSRLGGAGLPIRRAVPIDCRRTAAYLACLDPQKRNRILPRKQRVGGNSESLEQALA